METLIGAAVVIIGALFAAFGIGRVKGRGAAESAAAAERNVENLAAAEKRTEALKNATDVQQNINRQSDDAVDQQLREKWRTGAGGD